MSTLNALRAIVCALSLALVAPATMAGPSRVARTLDDVPEVSIDDARVREGDEGDTMLVFTVRLSPASPTGATVAFASSDGTAKVSDQDYSAASGTLSFLPDDSVATISVVIHGDHRLEGNEWFWMRLSSPAGCALADSEAFGWIVNDERATWAGHQVSLIDDDYRAGTLTNSWADLNGDGFLDIPLFFGGPGTSFWEIPGFRDLLANGNYHGASTCDYDRDGDMDMVILGYKLPNKDTPNILLRNNGDGTFENVAPQLGLGFSGNGETAVWGDFDGDGWPDLFAPFYTDLYPFQSFLWHNNGDGTFTDIAPQAGISTPGFPWTYRPEGSQAIDWNDDGYLDIYSASHLFINDGTAHFMDVREAVGLPETFDEGLNLVDIDNDGDLDIYLRTEDGPRMFRNDAGHYTEITEQAGIANPYWLWGDSFADADCDGDLDLVQHGGHPRLLLNQGDGTFVRDTTFELVSAQRELSCWGDLDNDGDQDLVIGTNSRQVMINHINNYPDFRRNILRVQVLDGEGHMTQYGASVRLTQLGDGPRIVQTRVVDGGSGYLGQSEYTVEFGGISSGRYALEVVFPSAAGTRWVVDSLTIPELGNIEGGQYSDGPIKVYRSGHAEFPQIAVAGIAGQWKQIGALHRFGPPMPNPASHQVSLAIVLERPARVSVSVHDLHGRQLRREDMGTLPVGRRDFVWDLKDEGGRAQPTGVYFGRLLVNGVPMDARRILVVR